MDAKELHQTMSMCHPNNWVITNPEIRATILRALSLLASVEGSSDEVVRELQRVVFPSLRDYGQGYSAAVAERAASHIIALRAELASVKANCKIVYWPKDGSYPIEHTMAANKDCYEMILAQMERDRAAHTKDAQ